MPMGSSPAPRPGDFNPRIVLSPSIVALVIVSLVASCAGTRLANVWRDPQYAGAPLSRIMVVSVNKDLRNRRLLEDGLAAELERVGVRAVRAYQQIPAGLPDTTFLMDEVRSGGYDGIVITHQVPSDFQTRYIRRDLTTAPAGARDWVGHYDAAFREVARADPEEHHMVRNEIDVWCARNACCVTWTGVGDEFDSRSTERVIQEFILVVAPELAASGLIPKK